MKNSSLIVFGKVIFTKQCLLHLSRVDTCIFISFTFKSHIYNVHLVKSELKLGDTIDLDDSLFEAYVEEKSNPIVGAIEQNVYKGGFQWKTCKKPTGTQKNFENKNI